MFNKKKTHQQLEETLFKLERIENYNRYLVRRDSENNSVIKALAFERDALIESNGKLKRDLEIESRQKEELAALLSEAKRDSPCLSDCKNRNNPNACRTCTRYPNAHDKYEVES